MSHDTIAINQRMNRFDGHHRVWLFGYGSLIFKADFPFIERRSASIANWSRRFWQGSHDHRGTHSAPGRVVTLVPDAGAVCAGMAYLITPQVFAHLDHREKNGYLRHAVNTVFDGDAKAGADATGADASAATGVDGSAVEGLVYIARQDNAAFLGEASEADIAHQIASASGPSGRNRDYLLDLAHALRALGKDDSHVFALERQLLAIEAATQR